jgi:DNA mismatch repair protein MutL
VQPGNAHYKSVDGVLFNLSCSTLVAFPAAWGSNYTLSENTSYIGDYAFAFAKLRQVDLSNVINIGNSGFVGATLESLMIPDGVTPSYLIYLDIDPQAIDVNIHPTKTEIKFEDDSVIFQILYACVKEALGKNSFGESIDFDREGMPEIPVFGRNFDEFHVVQQPTEGLDPTYNPFEDDGFPSEPVVDRANAAYQASEPVSDHVPSSDGFGTFGGYGGYPKTSDFISRKDDYGKLFEDKTMPTKSILILQEKYILTTSRSGLMAVHIGRAMERILYERFLKAVSNNAHVTQTALFPVAVQVGVENMCLFEEHSAMLSNLGFDIAPFGVDTIVVNGVPEGFSAEAGKVHTMISDLMLILTEDHNALPEMMAANMSSRLAKLGSHSVDPVTNPVEAQRLIDQLFACENSEYTVNGRRIVTVIPINEIDNKF